MPPRPKAADRADSKASHEVKRTTEQLSSTKQARMNPASQTHHEHDLASAVQSSQKEDVDASAYSNSDFSEGDSSEDDAEDDDGANRHAPILAVRLPSSKDDQAVKERLDRLKTAKKAIKHNIEPGVLYVGRIPQGFYEDEMKRYFSQFGDVTRLRLSRNRRTGAPKHYAYVEFADIDVARIVQETMDNYLIEGHLLQVRLLATDKVHPNLWVGSNRKWRNIPSDRIERLKHDGDRTLEERHRVEANLLSRQEERRARIREAGISYHFEGYVSPCRVLRQT